VIFGKHVRELVGGDAERDDERQVEKQFQRSSRPVPFVGITT
jgi:hypothetical protein